MFGIKRLNEQKAPMKNGDWMIGTFSDEIGKGWFIPRKVSFLRHVLKYF